MHRVKQAQLFRTLVLVFAMSGTVAGCNQLAIVPEPSPLPTLAVSPTPPVNTQNWSNLLPGQTIRDLSFTQAESLSHQGKTLLDKIQVSGSSDGTVTYAKRLMVSPTSPSGRYSILKACEQAEGGLCWAIYKVDRTQQTVQQTSIGKYGGLDWVQWSPDDRYAVFLEKMEGTAWFVVMDLQTGESKLSAELPTQPSLASFSWIGNRTFTISLADQSQFQGNIKALFPQ